MPDLTHDFARCAANAIAELARPSHSDAAESLAALEQSCGGLRGERLYAARSICRALWRLHGGDVPESGSERCLSWAVHGLRWQHLDDVINIGKSLERASAELDEVTSPVLRDLLRLVVQTVESDVRGTGVSHAA
jgi:hypothetical protein